MLPLLSSACLNLSHYISFINYKENRTVPFFFFLSFSFTGKIFSLTCFLSGLNFFVIYNSEGLPSDTIAPVAMDRREKRNGIGLITTASVMALSLAYLFTSSLADARVFEFQKNRGIRIEVLSEQGFLSEPGKNPDIPRTAEGIIELAKKLYPPTWQRRQPTEEKAIRQCGTQEFSRLFAALQNPAILDSIRHKVDSIVAESMPFSMGIVAMEADTTYGTKRATIPPERAFIISTQDGWGCLGGQEIKEDITDLVTLEDERFAQVNEVKNTDDSNNQEDLCLCFPAREVNGLPGRYVLRLGIGCRDPLKKGHLLIDHANLVVRENGHFLELKLKAEGDFYEAKLLYGRKPQLKTGLFSCRRLEPEKASFLKAYRLLPDLRARYEEMDKGWCKMTIAIDPLSLRDAGFIDRAEELLDTLDKEFSTSRDSAFLWDKSRVTTEKLEDIASRMEKEGALRYDISVESWNEKDMEKINRGKTIPPNLSPTLRQKISVKESNDQTVWGEICIHVRQNDRR